MKEFNISLLIANWTDVATIDVPISGLVILIDSIMDAENSRMTNSNQNFGPEIMESSSIFL